MSNLNVEQAIQLARALCADLQKAQHDTQLQAGNERDVRGAMAQDIDEARRLFGQHVGAELLVVFERAVEVCLVQNKPEQLRDDPLVRPFLGGLPGARKKKDAWSKFADAWPESVGAEISLVNVTSQHFNDRILVLARLPEDGLDTPGCSVRLEPSDSGLTLIGHGRLPTNAPEVTMTPQRGRFVGLRKLGEMEIGIATIDDEAIIRGAPAAKLLLRACEAPLSRLVPHDFRIDIHQSKVTVEILHVKTNASLAASLTDAIIDLWARLGHELHMKNAVYGDARDAP